jgi:endogenous inhibitor of DNA gyrase (YacG/DUF329 family)
MVTTVQCPQCQKPVTWDDTAEWKPFCSERCKLIDLGDWAEGNHRIADSKTQDDLEHFDYH